MMQARDIMTPDVITVGPDTPVEEVVSLLLKHRISGVPVMKDGAIVGIVTESDLLRRPDLGTARPHRWLELFRSSDSAAADYARTHGVRAGEVMTGNVRTIADTTPVEEIAELLESHGIKRLPVLRDGKLAGIVSRADVLRGLACRRNTQARSEDQRIRSAVLAELARNPAWAPQPADISVLVEDGVVHYWGYVRSPQQRAAMVVAAETMPGVERVEDHMLEQVDSDPLFRPNWPNPEPP
jgi:CBS domain-containing protein